jgi:hypothetical protein
MSGLSVYPNKLVIILRWMLVNCAGALELAVNLKVWRRDDYVHSSPREWFV